MAKTKRTETSDPTDRVVAAARERAADDGPEPASGGAGAVGAREGGVRLDLDDFEPAEDVVPEAEGDDGSGLLGVPSVDEVRDKVPGADLLGGGDAAGSYADPRERPGVTSGFDAPDAADAGPGGLVGQAGASDGDPLSSFLDAAEAKLGRDTGLTDPSQQTNASPAHGQRSVADKDLIGPDTLEEFENRNGVFIGPQEEIRGMMGAIFAPYREKEEEWGPYGWGHEPEPEDPPADTTPDTTPDPPDSDVVTGEADPPHDPPPEQPEADPDEVTGESDPPHEPPPVPDPDEGRPLPADIEAQLRADVGRFRRLRPETDDGTTDPSEIDEEQVGTASPLPTHAEVGQELFGQPATDVPSGAVGGGTPNTGADSQGAGVITPGDDQVVSGGAQRDDDPFGEAGGSLEPAADAPDDGDVAFVPSTDIAGPVDDGPDLPDDLVVGPPD